MPKSIEEWMWLIIAAIFIGFVFLIVLAVFPSPITWLCLGLVLAIFFLYPVVRNLPAILHARRIRRAQGHALGREELLISVTKQLQPLISVTKQLQPLMSVTKPLMPGNKQQQLSAPKNKQQQRMPEVKQSSLENPDVQKYIPPGLPPDLFL
ncbi:MAG TPA: hypothetical protein VN207_05755 [Ktedonobacteraceae bacterium]|nr:hypothetical protein [Ktedonobacteraceae bacterium]